MPGNVFVICRGDGVEGLVFVLWTGSHGLNAASIFTTLAACGAAFLKRKGSSLLPVTQLAASFEALLQQRVTPTAARELRRAESTDSH
jgi:hypothetical protein